MEAWRSRPSGISYPPAAKDELEDFESIHGTIPEDFRWFLGSCGGGVIGSEWVDGIDDLFSTQTKFHAECQRPNGWKTKELFIIGWDGSGNPFGILPDGRVVVEDHNFGGVHEIASSFGQFLLSGLIQA